MRICERELEKKNKRSGVVEEEREGREILVCSSDHVDRSHLNHLVYRGVSQGGEGRGGEGEVYTKIVENCVPQKNSPQIEVPKQLSVKTKKTQKIIKYNKIIK